MGSNRRELLSELEQAKNSLRASKRKEEALKKQSKNLIEAMKPLLPRIRTWAAMPLPEESNAFKVMTVGDCRRLLAALDGVDDASTPLEQASPSSTLDEP